MDLTEKFPHERHLSGPYRNADSNDPTQFDGQSRFQIRGFHLASPERDAGSDEESDFLKDYDDLDRSSEEASDVDSDYLDWQADIHKFKDSVLKFRAEIRHDSDPEIAQEDAGSNSVKSSAPRGRGRGRGARGRGVIRGPRKAAEPTGDIKYRMSKASQAFIDERYEEAKELVQEIIRINAETHEAWTLLASIFQELGDANRALLALIFAAHLRPKDVSQWLNCAKFALEQTGEKRPQHLDSARFCYSSAIRANPKDVEARCGKAALLREMGKPSSAGSELRHALKLRPHDLQITRQLAEVYLDQGLGERARDLYRDSIKFFETTGSSDFSNLSWSDVNIYIELLGYLRQYEEAIRELKSLSRWLLGRQGETYWDHVTEDDREYDLDDTRRLEIAPFIPGRFDNERYGIGLPMELRVKLGLYRLQLGCLTEAELHLNWLDPQNHSGSDKVLDYTDLFYECGDALLRAGVHDQALIFFKALLSTENRVDPSLHIQVGKCYEAKCQYDKGKDSFLMAIELDNANIEARIHLARVYELLHEEQQAFVRLNEIMSLRRSGNKPLPHNLPTQEADEVYPTKDKDSETQQSQRLYAILCSEQESMRSGQPGSVDRWMEAASVLIDDFRSCRAFYPWDSYVRFLGYPGSTGHVHSRMEPQSLDDEVVDMVTRMKSKFGAELDSENSGQAIPDNYQGISFETWLDIFLEYALCLTRDGKHRDAYEICEAAKDAVVFCHSRQNLFFIHVCWGACAVLANDEEVCVTVSRYFMRDYQFTTDAYRLFAALNRLCKSPISWYSSGPTQKYILRQIKAMDFALVDEQSRQRFFAEKSSYSALDGAGNPIINDELDVALLMLYGHILYSGASYSHALNYFYRAHALDPSNPMINLSIGLGYVHYGLKRQAENRQFQIMQGLSFLQMYYENRRFSSKIEERQEAHYNMARTYHLLGLGHLALPLYMKVLEELEEYSTKSDEALVLDVAYNLQALFAMSGNMEMAQAITGAYLTI